MPVYGFLSSMKVPLMSSVRATADAVGRERSMIVPHEAMKVVMGPVKNSERNESCKEL